MAYTISQNLNIRPKYFPHVVVHVSAGDANIPVHFSIYDGASLYTIPSGTTITVHGYRKDGGNWIVNGTYSGNVVSFTLPRAAMAIEGAGVADVVFTTGSEVVGSANFCLLVERATFPNGVSYSNDSSVFQDLLNFINSSAIPEAISDWLEENISATSPAVDASLTVQGAAADAKATGDALDARIVTQAVLSNNVVSFKNASNSEKFTLDLSALDDIKVVTSMNQMTDHSAVYMYTWTENTTVRNKLYFYDGEWKPLGTGVRTASTASQMTDTNAIYKYTGTESGYIQNALYYYNGTAWSPITPTDKTLAIANVPADAKTVGDRLSVVESAIGSTDVAELIPVSSSLDALVNSSGKVTASSVTKAFVYAVDADTTYTVNYDGIIGGDNAHFVADFVGIPSVGNTSSNYVYIAGGEKTVKIKTSATVGDHYLLVGHGKVTSSTDFEVYKGNPIRAASSLTDWEIGGVNTATGQHLDSTQRLRTANFIRVTKGTKIYASGREFVWCFYDTPTISSFNRSKTATALQTAEKTFTEDGYIIMAVKSSEDITDAIKEEIVSDTTIFFDATEVWNQIKSSLIDSFQDIKSTNYIPVGQPYAYLSETIEDEILDSKTVSDVYAIYDDLCTNHPETMVRLPDIGTETSQNLPIRMYRLKWTEPWMVNVEASWKSSNNLYESSYDNYRNLLITAGTHGNEKSSVYGVALAIKEIVESDKEFAKYIRANFSMDIIPVVNPAGFNATTRNNGSNVNINRDFHTRATAEAQAVYNVLTSNDYYAVIDSHNSGGNANYIGATKTNKLLSEYVQIAMKFGQMFYNDWDALCENEQYATAPYMQFWANTDEGMFQDLLTELNQVGYLIETVGVFASREGTLTPNHKKFCKFTKDLFVNSIIALGTTDW